jgi:hypothetical protein
MRKSNRVGHLYLITAKNLPDSFISIIKINMTKNTLSRRDQSKQDKSIDIDEQIERLDEDLRRLKIEFDIYFNGGTRKAPLQKRASLEARIKRINGNRNLSFAHRFRLNNMISQFTSYRELWRRRLKAKGEEIY